MILMLIMNNLIFMRSYVLQRDGGSRVFPTVYNLIILLYDYCIARGVSVMGNNNNIIYVPVIRTSSVTRSSPLCIDFMITVLKIKFI